MSAVQSHIQTGIPDTQFSFSTTEQNNKLLPRQGDQQRSMNPPPPHLGNSMPPQGSMLNLYGGGHPQQQQQFQQQLAHQQSQHQQGPHPPLGMMPNNQSLVPNAGSPPTMQQQQQAPHQQMHNIPQRMMMHQRPLGATSGPMGNPQAPMQQNMFPPGNNINPQRRLASHSQPQSLPQAAAQMNVGMQPQQQNSLHGISGQMRPSGVNTRMLPHGPPPPHDLHVGIGRAQPPQLQQQSSAQILNGLHANQLPRGPPGGQLGGPPHQIPHSSQQQPTPTHRPPFQPPQGPLPAHQSLAPSPTRPPSIHSQNGPSTGSTINPPTPGQQPGMRPQQTSPPNSMFLNLQQQPQNMFSGHSSQQHPPQQPQRPLGGAPQTFPFLPDAPPANQRHSESPGQIMAGSSNSSIVPPTRQAPQSTFQITPVQQLQQPIQQHGGPGHVMIPHTPGAHQHRVPHPQTTSPLPTSGPSNAENQPQAGPSRTTPRPPSRHPNQVTPRTSVTSGQPHVQPILPASSPQNRRASVVLPTPGGSQPQQPAIQHESAQPSNGTPQLPRQQSQQPLTPPNVVGAGQGVYRLMQFSSAIANDNGERLTYNHWARLVNEYFSSQAIWKLTLWKDNDHREAKLFEIVPNVIAMLFLVSSQSGVRSMNFILDGARERSYTLGTSVVDCPNAQWVWRFYDGHVITLRGTFSCQLSAYNVPSDGLPYTIKIDSMSFDSASHERMIMLDAIQGIRGVETIQKTPATTTQGSPDNASSSSTNTVKSEESNDRPVPETDSRIVIEHALLPSDPINAFAIPQASMRCLELAESVGQMTDLFQYGFDHKLGPQDALAAMAQMIRSRMPASSMTGLFMGENNFTSSSLSNNPPISDRPLHNLHSASSQAAHPPGQPTQSGLSQSSPRQHPPPQPPTPSKSLPSANVSAPTGPSTSLKRKAPVDGPLGPGGPLDSQPPLKRVSRRKSKAGGG